MINSLKNSTNHPAYITGFLWFAFSGTAMLSAFILPVHIWALSTGYDLNVDTIFHKLYFVILFISALYHGLYRTKTILFDLGVVRFQKAISVITGGLCVAFSVVTLLLIFG